MFLSYAWFERYELPMEATSHPYTFVSKKEYVGIYSSLEAAVEASRKFCKKNKYRLTENRGEAINIETGERTEF